MDELGLTMVDEGLLLRQLMRQACRQRIVKKAVLFAHRIETFMEFIEKQPNVFRLLLRERSGTSFEFRTAVAREIQHFSAELTEYLITTGMTRDEAFTQAKLRSYWSLTQGRSIRFESSARRTGWALDHAIANDGRGGFWYRKGVNVTD